MSDKTQAKEYIALQVYPNGDHEVTAQNMRNAFDKALETCPSFDEGQNLYGKKTDLGNIAALKTTAKTSTVAAINELHDNSATKTELANIGSKVDGLVKPVEISEENVATGIADDKNNLAFAVDKEGNLLSKKFNSAKATLVEDNDCTYAYAVVDKLGYVAFAIDEQGNVLSKNFDSKKISTIKSLLQKAIYIEDVSNLIEQL